MPVREILYEDRARSEIAQGLDILADAVKVTLGPRGRAVLIDSQWGAPTVTKDGATVAQQIELDNPFANLGAQMVKEVASKTSDVAGDGTTTATVLAQAIFTAGSKLVSAGANPMDIKRGIDAAVSLVVAELQRLSKPIVGRDEIAQVGTVSANGDETIGQLVADAMERVGFEGVISVEQASSIETTLEFVEGMMFDRGYLSPYFITDADRMASVLDEAYILIHEKRLSNIQSLLPLLELVAQSKQPLLIIAEDVDEQALTTLVVNNLRGTLRVCAVKSPGFGDRRLEMLTDLAVVLGGKVVAEALGLKLEELTLEDLGRAKTVIVDKDSTTLIEGAGESVDVQARGRQLQSQIFECTSDADKAKLQERLAKIKGGVAVIKVGAATEIEMKARTACVEDSLHATRAAIEEGIVPGGGVALLRTLGALQELELEGDQQFGVNIIRRALEEPLRQIAENGGLEGAIVVNNVLQSTGAYGFNAITLEYEDLIQAGIIDPTKVVRVALQNAASVASVMLTTEALIADRPSKRP